MKKVLFIATIYRCGEKIYPIIPHLCKDYEVDMLMFNQMSDKTPWHGNSDPRPQFYKNCGSWGANVIHGTPNKIVKNRFRNGKFLSRHTRKHKYDLIILDDNKGKTNWGTHSLCKYLRGFGHEIIGSPHGNHEFNLYNFDKKIGTMLDYSFVFGDKEKQNLKCSKYNKKKLIPAGIPSNDVLVNYKRENKYILVVVSYVENYNSVRKKRTPYLPFNEDTLIKSGILDLRDKYNKPIIIKEKSRFKKGLDFSLKHLEDKYDGLSVIMDHPDDNKLIMDAAFLVSAPSTLCFKAIQVGIPTVLLKKFGMKGNFYDFPGFCDINSKTLMDKINWQVKNGKCSDFIRETLTGGSEFNSTDIHLETIREILNGRKNF